MNSKNRIVVRVLIEPAGFQRVLSMRLATELGGVHLTLEYLEDLQRTNHSIATEKEKLKMQLGGTYTADKILAEEALKIGYENEDHRDRLRNRMQELYDQGAFTL